MLHNVARYWEFKHLIIERYLSKINEDENSYGKFLWSLIVFANARELKWVKFHERSFLYSCLTVQELFLYNFEPILNGTP